MTTPESLREPLPLKVVLWDMDGVLIDSLGLDLAVVGLEAFRAPLHNVCPCK